MGYRDLSTKAMADISAAWIDDTDKGVGAVIAAIPETNGLKGSIGRAHNAILSIQANTSAKEAALGAIVKELAAVDNVHDRKLRGIFKVLDGLAELTEDPQQAQALNDLRENLFDVGLLGVNLSYRDESGAVRLAEERTTEDDIALLGSIPVLADGGSLKDHYATLTQAALQLGALEDKRARLEGTKDADHVAAKDVLNARHLWVRTAHSVERALSVSDATSEQITLILSPLHGAHAKTSP